MPIVVFGNFKHFFSGYIYIIEIEREKVNFKLVIKIGFFKSYKFTIAFENAQLPGWTTEKLIHPFMARSVPIYWGDPNVAEYYNPKAFINCNDYDNDFDAVIRVVKDVDADSERYMEMLNQPVLKPSYPVNWESDLLDFFVGIIEGTKRLPDKKPIGFEAVTACSYSSLIEEGKVGLSKITHDVFLNYGKWINYKIMKRRNKPHIRGFVNSDEK